MRSRLIHGPAAAFAAAALVACLAALPREAAAIVGGEAASGALARSSLMVLNSRGGVCSAVVVAADAVLTAGHCVAGGVQARIHWKGDDGQPVLIEPAAVAVHKGYASDAVAARRRSIDLALVRAPSALPARFAPATLAAQPARVGATVTVAGYGVAREGDGRSTGTFRSAALTVVEPYGPSRILLWAEGGGAGACEGDSGGPMLAGSAVVAITSWATGPKGRGCGRYTQGVLVGPQRDWIDATLAAWGQRAAWD